MVFDFDAYPNLSPEEVGRRWYEQARALAGEGRRSDLDVLLAIALLCAEGEVLPLEDLAREAHALSDGVSVGEAELRDHARASSLLVETPEGYRFR